MRQRTVARGFLLPGLLLALIAVAPARAADLAPVPHPALENLDPAERRQLEETRAVLDALLEDPPRDEPARAGLARAFGGVGRLYLLYDLVDAAAPALANASALAPAEHAWAYYLGVVHQREGRLDEARTRFTRAADLAPRDLPTRLRLAEVELAAGRLDAAEAAYRAALEIEPESSEAAAAAHVGLGRIAYERGRSEEAIERFTRALALQPGADSIHHRLGLAYRQAGDLDSAREHLALNRSTPVRYPDPLVDGLTALLQGAAIRFKSGNRAMTEGRLADAIAEYERAAEVAPEDPLVHYNLGLALTRAGRRAEAVGRFETAIALDPGYRDAHYNLAVALGEEGRWTAAAEHFERAWRIDPLDHAARLDWATALAGAGEPAAAEREIEAVLAALGPRGGPLAGRAHLRLAALLGARGERAAVLEHLRAAVRLLPEDPEARTALADLLAHTGRYAEAAEEYAAAARLEPEGAAEPPGDRRGAAEPRLGQAMALLLDGRSGEARALLEREIAGKPLLDVVPYAHLLARVLAAAPESAVRDGRRAVELAGEALRASVNVDHVETLAMAYAEVGDFASATVWQRRVLDRARERGFPAERVERIRRRMEAYQRGEPARSPWEEP